MTHVIPSSLIERLEAAQGADREIDKVVAVALLDPKSERNYYIWQSSRPQGSLPKPEADYWDEHRTPAYTASIDAALALVERVLPGWWVTILEAALREIAWAHTLEGPKPGPDALCRAILIHLLRALTSKDTP